MHPLNAQRVSFKFQPPFSRDNEGRSSQKGCYRPVSARGRGEEKEEEGGRAVITDISFQRVSQDIKVARGDHYSDIVRVESLFYSLGFPCLSPLAERTLSLSEFPARFQRHLVANPFRSRRISTRTRPLESGTSAGFQSRENFFRLARSCSSFTVTSSWNENGPRVAYSIMGGWRGVRTKAKFVWAN